MHNSYVIFALAFCLLCFIGSALAQQPKATALASQPTLAITASRPEKSAPASQPAKGIIKLPKELTLKLNKGVTMKLLLIPAGEFMMGSPENEKDRDFRMGPQHKVSIRNPFYIGEYEVTQGQWLAIADYRNSIHAKCIPGPDGEIYDNLPAYLISWDDCQEFCHKMSLKTGQTVRLPSEAEWEYACRTGTTTRFFFGDDLDYTQLRDYAWYKDNYKEGLKNTYLNQVGQKKPNPWGLYDIYGSMLEWCQDEWHATYEGAPNNEEPWLSGIIITARVLRGGGGDSQNWKCTSAYRTSDACNIQGYGFRVVVEVPKAP